MIKDGEMAIKEAVISNTNCRSSTNGLVCIGCPTSILEQTKSWRKPFQQAMEITIECCYTL